MIYSQFLLGFFYSDSSLDSSLLGNTRYTFSKILREKIYFCNTGECHVFVSCIEVEFFLFEVVFDTINLECFFAATDKADD